MQAYSSWSWVQALHAPMFLCFLFSILNFLWHLFFLFWGCFFDIRFESDRWLHFGWISNYHELILLIVLVGRFKTNFTKHHYSLGFISSVSWNDAITIFWVHWSAITIRLFRTVPLQFYISSKRTITYPFNVFFKIYGPKRHYRLHFGVTPITPRYKWRYTARNI